MKIILILTLIILPVSVFSQVWQQTAGTPEGSGVTEMVVRQSNQHIFVTTGCLQLAKWRYGRSKTLNR